MEFFLVVAAFGLGFWASQREAAGKFPFEPRARTKRWVVGRG